MSIDKDRFKKASGYLPIELHKHLEDFADEWKISISQALINILSERFGVVYQVDRQSSLPLNDRFATLDQFRDLEQKVSELPSELLSESKRIIEAEISKLRNELLSELNKPIELGVDKIASLPSELLSEPKESNQVVSLPSELLTSELLSEPKEESSSLQLDIEETLRQKELITQPVTNASIESIQGKILAIRLGVTAGTVSNKKNDLSEEEFYQWLKEKDPDGISWKPVGGDLKQRISGWIPADNTPSELLSRLSDWIKNNKFN